MTTSPAKPAAAKPSGQPQPAARPSGPRSEGEEQLTLQSAPLTVVAQYLRDLSYESPNVPDALAQSAELPLGSVEIDVQVKEMGESRYEVGLRVSVDATRHGKSAYFIQIEYAGLFQVGKIDPNALEPVLMIQAPRLLFPYARAIITTVSSQGGFAPLYINPVDFYALYQQYRERRANERGKERPTPS